MSELFLYIFSINFLMYSYQYIFTRDKIKKTKQVVIYGAGSSGQKLEKEFKGTEYKIIYFIDDNKNLQNRSIDNIGIYSIDKAINNKKDNIDLLVIAMPSATKKEINKIYNKLEKYFIDIKILPTLDEILRDKDFKEQLQEFKIEDLLARHPQDLDKDKISSFIKDKIILITGAGGSIGSEIVRQCIGFGAKQIIALDHSEYNLYAIHQEMQEYNIIPVMQSVVDKKNLSKTFQQYKPDIVIHAAAYKHVPLVEYNIQEAIINNVLGTKNTIDCAITHNVSKFILVSTDKAVRPTNVMGTTKRICELYAQNKQSEVSSENNASAKNIKTEIVAVRFGNVLGSSGSVIPKFKEQIEKGGPITVTHPDITRYFMLIPEACELVLQAGSLGSGGEIFILDMGKPTKIVDLAQKMIELSGKKDIEIKFTGLRPGEKLYEELLIDETDCTTEYDSITVAKSTIYDIDKLNEDINELLSLDDTENILLKLKDIVKEFNHNKLGGQ